MKDAQSYRTGGGGASSLAGLPVLLFGVVFSGAAVLVAREELAREGGTPLAGLPFALFGLAALLASVAILVGRKGVVLDGSRRTVTRWWGLLGWPLHRRVSSVPDVALITFEREARRSGKTTIVVFPVRIGGATGETTLLGEPRDRDEARRIAERAGKAFGADVEDRTLSAPSRRRADELDLSLRQRHRGEPPPPPRRPAAPRCTYRAGRSETTVEVPPAMPAAVTLAKAGVGCVAALFLLPLALALAAGFPPVMLGVMAGVWALMSMSGLLAALKGARRASSPTRLALRREAITVTWPDEQVELPTDRLEEVGFAAPGPSFFPSERLLLISDARTVEVPLALEAPEREWVAELVRYVAATGEPPPEAADAA